MESQITINFMNGKSETYRVELDENMPVEQIRQRYEAVFSGHLLRLRVQHEMLDENDKLLVIPFTSIESISVGLPLKEFGFSEVLLVSPV